MMRAKNKRCGYWWAVSKVYRVIHRHECKIRTRGVKLFPEKNKLEEYAEIVNVCDTGVFSTMYKSVGKDFFRTEPIQHKTKESEWIFLAPVHNPYTRLEKRSWKKQRSQK